MSYCKDEKRHSAGADADGGAYSAPQTSSCI